jgi:hypothetical protein
MESGFMKMVVADTMKKRQFIAILCMHKMRTRAISPGVWWLQELIPVFYGEAACLIRKQSPSTA